MLLGRARGKFWCPSLERRYLAPWRVHYNVALWQELLENTEGTAVVMVSVCLCLC